VVYRSGEKEESLTLTVTARVVTEITVEPPVLALSTDTAIAHEITVTDRRERPLDLLAVQSSLPQLRTSLGEPRRDDQGRWCRAVRVEVLPDCPEGRHEAVLHLLTNDPTYAALNVPLTVTKRSRAGVRATPEAVSLSAAGAGPLPARIVLLDSADGRPVAVERVESDDPAVRCSWAAGPGPRATLKVQIDRSPRRPHAANAHGPRHLHRQVAGASAPVHFLLGPCPVFLHNRGASRAAVAGPVRPAATRAPFS
jgi:hypothetical protein